MKEFKLLALSPEEKATLLDTFDLVDGLATNHIEKLVIFLKAYSVSSGLTIIHEGEKGHFFCLVCKGQVDIVKADVKGALKTVNSLGAGKIIGEIAFFDNVTSSASVMAKQDVTLLIMDRTSFSAFCADSPYAALQITLKLLKYVSQRLRQTTGKLVDFL
ncbi:MAG: cyclic nucleotide-binding domain-containing protein [Gammaproteobacteria bacterium]|nr:cyclic nucleotide-binding domain-containing protein [Gammaproteobacteria bacterium]